MQYLLLTVFISIAFAGNDGDSSTNIYDNGNDNSNGDGNGNNGFDSDNFNGNDNGNGNGNGNRYGFGGNINGNGIGNGFNNNNNGNRNNNFNGNNGFGAGGYYNRGYNSNDRCDDISSKDNKIFGELLCGNLVSKYDGDEYDQARQQYSTLNEHGNIRTMPNYIIKPDPHCDDNDNDIKLTLEYARECDYKISIRSGGDQYNGLSSCDYIDRKCIQIDVQLYNYFDVLDTNIKLDNHDHDFNAYDSNGNGNGNSYGNNGNENKDGCNHKDYTFTIIEAGPGIEVDELWTYLKTNEIFFPTDSRASLGAQIVQGGSGNLLRLGTTADYVIGFEIILADGYKYLIQRPDYEYFDGIDNNYNNKYSTYKHNDELFAAVLGGGPGSFGIVTNIYLKTFSTYDFKDNVFWKLEWDYSPPLLMKVGYQFTDLLNSDYYRNDPNKYVGLDITDETVTYYGSWIKICGDKKYNKFEDKIIDDFRQIGEPRVIIPLAYEKTITHNNIDIFENTDDWQYQQPMFNQKQYSNNHLNYDVIDIINDRVKYIYDYPKLGIRLNPGSLRITDELSLNSLAMREYGDATAQQNRQTMFAVFVETLQYDYKINKYARDHAIEWMDELFTILMKNEAFDGEDIRGIGFTNSFGKFDMETEWAYYFENGDEYNKVRDVKTYVDEYEIFNGNDFTIPSLRENGNNNY